MSEHKILSEAEIRALLADTLENLFEIEPERIKPDTNLYEDLEIDSIDAIDLIDRIKRETGRKLNGGRCGAGGVESSGCRQRRTGAVSVADGIFPFGEGRLKTAKRCQPNTKAA